MNEPRRYAEVAVYEPKVQGVFHYHIPPKLQGAVQKGAVVEVEFGARRLYGVVTRLLAEPEVAETKPILSIPEPELRLTEAQLALAEWLAAATLAPLSAAIGLMLPRGALQTADTLYRLTDEAPAEPPADLDQTARLLFEHLRERPMRGRQIARALPRRNWRRAAEALRRRGWLTSQPVLPRLKTSRSYEKTVSLLRPYQNAQAKEVGKSEATQTRRLRLLKELAEAGGKAEARRLLALSGAKSADLKALEKAGFVRVELTARYRDPLARLTEPSPETPPPLTAAQAKAWERIAAALSAASAGAPPPPFLLHGVTGSGKTEIYLRAVGKTLALGRQAVVLVPEIALTPQTVRRFLARFPGKVGLLHSQLSAGERYDTWMRVRRGEIGVLIGPRSALFAPFPNLGLIVVDECHSESYYEAERTPHYHARTTALEYGKIASAVVILGTATPDTTTYFQAKQGKIQLLTLPDRILAHRRTVEAQAKRAGMPRKPPAPRFRPIGEEALAAELPPVQVVDMRAELKAGHTGIFSRALLGALSETLARGEQAILFLNRRGSATYVFCRDCGYVMKCPKCGTPLTYHKAENALICHHCGYRRKMPTRCPACGSTRIRPYGAGTERVEEEVHRHFPRARTLRWDADTARARGSHAAILDHFVSRRADVLIGTQMLAKGLDLPFVTLVGIVLADVGLTLPDYRAAERGFQLLTQVAGRAGRSPLGGKVILQTYMPDHYAIQAAARHDFAAFYRRELENRRKLGYPPYAKLVRLLYRSLRAEQAEDEAEMLAERLRALISRQNRTATQIIGPAPCFFERLNGWYRWQIVVRGPDPASLIRPLRLPEGWQVEVCPPSLL